MNLRLLASGAAIVVAGVIGYGLYQLVPMGKPLARNELIGELNGPPLASSSRVSLQRFGERQLLVGQRLVTGKDLAGLEQAPLLDALVPALGTRPQNPWQLADTRNLIYGGQGTGVFKLLGSISGDTGVTLIGSPEGRTLYLVTGTPRSPGIQNGGGDPPAAWETLRSDDQGKTWTYDPDAVLGPPLQYTVFLTQDRVIALERHDAGQRLLVSEDGARHWSATLLDEQVWPDAQAFDRAFQEKAGKDGSQLAYDWSLFPLDDRRAVGWSWRTRISLNAAEKTKCWKPGALKWSFRAARLLRSASPPRVVRPGARARRALYPGRTRVRNVGQRHL